MKLAICNLYKTMFQEAVFEYACIWSETIVHIDHMISCLSHKTQEAHKNAVYRDKQMFLPTPVHLLAPPGKSISFLVWKYCTRWWHISPWGKCGPAYTPQSKLPVCCCTGHIFNYRPRYTSAIWTCLPIQHGKAPLFSSFLLLSSHISSMVRSSHHQRLLFCSRESCLPTWSYSCTCTADWLSFPSIDH